MSDNMIENATLMANELLKGFGNINKDGSSKLDDITNKTNDTMSKFSGLDDSAMQMLDTAATAIPGGAQVMGVAKLAHGLEKGDAMEVVDGATDLIPGVKQIKEPIKKMMKMS